MYRVAISEHDERIRAAVTAQDERDHLVRVRADLASDLAMAESRVSELAASLAEEERDVARYERGVWAFLYDVFADREARLTREQLEAAAAAARLTEAKAARDRLREECAALDSRIAAHADVDTQLAAARTAKHAALIASGSPAGEELERIAEELGRLDSHRQATDEALAAGAKAQDLLVRLAAALASAHSWGTVDIWTDSALVSWAKRDKLDEARGIAGQAQAALLVFQRELADVGVALDAQVGDLADHHRFLDVWFDNIFSDFSVQSRIAEAQDTTTQAKTRVAQSIEWLRAQKASFDARVAELTAMRDRHLEPG